MAETDTNAYDSTFTDFHALPFTLRSSAMPAMPQPFSSGMEGGYGHTDRTDQMEWTEHAKRNISGEQA